MMSPVLYLLFLLLTLLAEKAEGGDESGRAKLPVFFMHGINDGAGSGGSLEHCIKEAFPGTEWMALNIAEGNESYQNVMDQVRTMKDRIQKKAAEDPENFKNGYNLVCHSQGAVICRALVSTWSEHQVQTFVSLAGPQMGVEGYGQGVLKSLPGWALSLGTEVFYTPPMQRQASFANYWKDVNMYSRYQMFSSALAVINNEAPAHRCEGGFLKCHGTPGVSCAFDYETVSCQLKVDQQRPEKLWNLNPEMKTNFQKLRHAVFLGSKDDGAIIPWQSTVWGYWSRAVTESGEAVAEATAEAGEVSSIARRRLEETSVGQSHHAPWSMRPWNETDVAVSGLVPLKAMDSEGKLHIRSVDGVGHTDWLHGKGCEVMKEWWGDLLS
uniref:palmitoyl-CoA hydrolase n=1 Tax=Chromera velia CCMP2878 TaxID=1169474 RepID=A0A0G4G7V7_9ALVE|eukprot:Cvel_4310.t1-p1 / transcript=Cvel_4310.t1 / gene=Cvel_4310 / organism=Chromera_velia_CCMP2878 / gene_product=Lysosomal thioesterase PPT2, putative / transcript_product=Lysosomal thioesterase PPT2, putative / location=Cvel_scaffold187:14993-16135(-) / protein_length=381 / sequence_SO=supercontig / SO=protein_coding / is_pseudo=false